MSADLDRAVTTVVEHCLGIRAGEDVLVIADPATRALGERLRDAAAGVGADAVLALIDERPTHGSEPPRPVAAALAACDVYIAPTAKSLSHTTARRAAQDAGARGATMPTVTAELLARVMPQDFTRMAARSRAVADLLTASDSAHISCPRGTDLRLDLHDRTAIADDGDLTSPGAFGNLPCGEGFVPPAGGEGTAFVSSLADSGLAPDPVELTIVDGRLVGASGEQGRKLLDDLAAGGELGTNLAELGVGTNERAGVIGEIIEDEKALGTVHIAFGSSKPFGGTVSASVHLDCVVVEPTLTVGDVTVVDHGRFVL